MDVVNVTGNVTPAGSLNLTDLAPVPAKLPLGTKLTIVSYTGTLTGTFDDNIRRVIEHIDFVAVKAGEKVTVAIPVVTVGEAGPDPLVTLEHAELSVEAEATHVPESIEVSVEGINLTDDYRDRFTDFDANRNYENNHFGRTILFGARFRL